MKKIIAIAASLVLITSLAFATPGDTRVEKTVTQSTSEALGTLSPEALAFMRLVITEEILSCAEQKSCPDNELALGFTGAVIGVLAQIQMDSAVITKIIRKNREEKKDAK